MSPRVLLLALSYFVLLGAFSISAPASASTVTHLSGSNSALPTFDVSFHLLGHINEPLLDVGNRKTTQTALNFRISANRGRASHPGFLRFLRVSRLWFSPTDDTLISSNVVNFQTRLSRILTPFFRSGQYAEFVDASRRLFFGEPITLEQENPTTSPAPVPVPAALTHIFLACFGLTLFGKMRRT
ncbi:MAG: hypothetical protein ABJL99_20715 [Aliishimia sp.]